jgi:hypothetical protein
MTQHREQRVKSRGQRAWRRKIEIFSGIIIMKKLYAPCTLKKQLTAEYFNKD